MSKKNKTPKGFTLIEILVVISIVVIVVAAGANIVSNSSGVLNFQTQVDKVAALFREARTLSLAGVSVPDYTDYDDDNTFAMPPGATTCTQAAYEACTTKASDIAIDDTSDSETFVCTCASQDDETVIAAGIGLFIKEDSEGGKIYLFTDMHNNSELSFDPNDSDPDIVGTPDYTDKSDIVQSFKQIDFADTDYKVEIEGSATELTIIYTPPYGDLVMNWDGLGVPSLIKIFISDKNNAETKSQITLHKVSGIPEVAKPDA